VAGNILNWLHLMERHGATYSAAPNFAYALVNKALASGARGEWDLSSLRILLMAGEMVSPSVAETFLANLTPHGLAATALQPAFGMAEMGSGITYFLATPGRPHQFYTAEQASLAKEIVLVPPDHPRGVRLTSLGAPIPDLSIRIADDQHQVLSEYTVGHFQVKGAAVFSGYYNNPAANQAAFTPDGWFDTGDLGFIADGELVLTGRAKEVIIINGANIQNSEIEAAVEAVDGVAVSFTAACAVRPLGSESEQVAIFFSPALAAAETGEEQLAALLANIRQSVVKRVGIKPDYLLPVAREEIPKTAIGKIQRVQLARRFEAGEFNDLLQQTKHLVQASQPMTAPRNDLERRLARLWQEVLGSSPVGIHDDFFAAGGDSLRAAHLITRIQEEFGDTFHVIAIFQAPTVAQLAAYLEAEYPSAVARVLGKPLVSTNGKPHPPISMADVNDFRQRLPVRPPLQRLSDAKNPLAIFVLAAGRTGSTLLRVMLAGHPQLFAPPELVLLTYETLAEREAALTGESSIWREGVLKAVTQLYGWSVEQATAWMAQLAQEGETVQAFYRRLQATLGERLLVEKTPQYTLELEVLQRAERYFEDVHYLHLVRHPHAAIRSFEEARLDQLMLAYMPSLYGEAGARKFSTRELGELAWLTSQQNILRFLQDIPTQRQHLVHFETLVKEPRPVMEGICQFLGLEFVPGMVQPYQETQQRMTTGLREGSRMLGDVKFHQHKTIDAGVAERWQSAYRADFLGDVTWEMAERLGYARPTPPQPSPDWGGSGHEKADDLGGPAAISSLNWGKSHPEKHENHDDPFTVPTPTWGGLGRGGAVSLSWLVCPRPNPQARQRLFCFHYAGGSASLFRSWPQQLPSTVELCAVQLPGRERRLQETPFTDLDTLATVLAEQLAPELDRPFALFGYSMGGLVAFALARELRRQGLPVPQQLLVAARRAPHLPQPGPHFSQLPDAEIVGALRAAGNALPQELAADHAVLQLMLPTLRADFRLAETYIYHAEAPLDCPITVFGGTEDEHANCSALAGWRLHTSQGFQVYMFEGGHFFWRSAEAALVRVVGMALEEQLTPP
jgi:surfactin synthase thioesterase subunit/acyl carrier protein